MIVFLIFTILYQITMSRALNPLLYNMPCTIQAEEELLNGQSSDHDDATMMEEASAQDLTGERKSMDRRRSVPLSTHMIIPEYKPNMFQKFAQPWRFTDYWTLRNIVCRGSDFNIPETYSYEVERNAYLPPSVRAPAPTLWIPRDPASVSRAEINDAFSVVAMTDEGCMLDRHNRMVWNTEDARPPIWVEKIDY